MPKFIHKKFPLKKLLICLLCLFWLYSFLEPTEIFGYLTNEVFVEKKPIIITGTYGHGGDDKSTALISLLFTDTETYYLYRGQQTSWTELKVGDKVRVEGFIVNKTRKVPVDKDKYIIVKQLLTEKVTLLEK